MSAFVLSSINGFVTPKCKDVLLEGGECMLYKTGEDSLPSSSSVMDIGGKQLDIGFYSGMIAKKVNIIQDVRTKSNLGTWGVGFDLTSKSNGKAIMRKLHKTVVLVFKIIVKNWNGDRRE